MDHIVAIIHPFVLKQEIDVYRNGECVEVQQCDMKDIEEMCYALCKKYDIHQLDLHGNQIYGLHIKDKMAIDKFSDFNINVDII